MRSWSRAVETLLGASWGVVAFAKLALPDREATVLAARSLGVQTGWVEFVLVSFALLELGVAVGLVVGWGVVSWLRGAFVLSGVALVLWAASGQFRGACGCFGRLFGTSPWLKLAVVVALFTLTFAALWARLGGETDSRSGARRTRPAVDARATRAN
jgi:hypothetical protein